MRGSTIGDDELVSKEAIEQGHLVVMVDVGGVFGAFSLFT
jgi:hypothetical protein